VSVVYEIGPFRLDPEAGVLTHAGIPTALGSRAVAVLTALVERANEYVPKARIIDAAWPGVVVEESNLAVQISAIRRVLADAGGERWIETLARRGYRFVGPVAERRDSPAQGSARASRLSNLPEPLTSFIGRERELVEIKRLLPGKRLLTLVGVGGIGKTRLALQVAAEVVDAYRDGVWLAELGSIRDPSLVPTSVAQALGVQERAGTPLTESLRGQLKSRQVLLIIDNCEHLLDACVRLVDALLRGAADVTVVATSREPLRVASEQIYPLQPLSLPEQGASAETMERSEAVQLFVERVQRQLPGFELTTSRAHAVAELCIHLDGIPLALELAAARARSLSVEQISARLGDRFRLLTGGSRTALPRQQTLRATLDWSYDLLAEDERAVLQRLSIFPSSFTVEAASAVASDAAIDEFAVIDLLSQLVARSLVIADTTAGGTRYRLLETTRAYALEKLAEVGEAEIRKRRHAEYFRDLFEQAPDDWLRMPDAKLRATYLPELDHVRAALDWALGPDGDRRIGIALAGASGPLWGTFGLFGEGVHRLEVALGLIEPHTSESEQARLWLGLGRLVDETPPRARPAFERAAELYRRLSEPLWLGLSLVRLGRVLAFMGRFEDSEALLTEAHSLLERAGPPKLLSFYFFNFGFLKALTGDLVSARSHYEQSLALDREMGDEFGALAAFGNLANVTWALGDLDAAAASLRQQVEFVRNSPMRTKRLLGYALTNLAGVLTERGDLDDALAAAREGLPLVKEDGSAWIFVDHVALRAALAGKLSHAARLAGYSDYTWAAQKATRHPVEARSRDRLHALLHEKLAPDEIERLLAEGAKMSDDEACRLALEE
jgi:predicted ATPase/DNA-binding winged helix-turn-helix (wHTH) protein